MEHFTTVIADLRARVETLELALKHQRELTAAAERQVRPSDHGALPETSVWHLAKGDRRAECRLRIVPIGDGLPELRIFVSSRETGELDLRYSQVCTLADFTALAAEMQRGFHARGWTTPAAVDTTPIPPHK